MNENKLKKAFGKVKTEMIDLKSEMKILNQKISRINNESENNHLDIEMVDTRFAEFAEMINEKVSMEIAAIKIDLESEINKIISNKKDFNNLNSNKDNIKLEKKVDNTFSELNEILNEKINIDINGLRLEITDEIAKLYDRFFSEIVEFRNELNKKTIDKLKNITKDKNKLEKNDKKSTKKTENKLENIEKKKESKIKKVAKWLFVDEANIEDDEILNIKKEVKKNK